MEGKKPQFSFGPTGVPEDHEPTVRELRLLEDTARKAVPTVSGYNPYNRDSATALSAKPKAPKPDLRKLSEWIKLKKEVDDLKAKGPQPPAPPRRTRR
jgi:hypothetical protein